jgi:hypothetical protein
MKYIFTLLIILVSSFYALSQKSLQTGWVELNNGDTLFGKIGEKEWNINPTKITFYKTNETTYLVNDIKSFGLIDGDIYSRYIVSRHLIPYREDAVFPEDDKKIDTITAWLKIVVQADISLAALYQAERVYFYVIDKDGKATELIAGRGIRDFNSEKYRNDPRYGKTGEIEDATYKNQLNALFSDHRGSVNLNLLDYTETGLKRLFRKSDNSPQITERSKSFFIGISGGISSFSSTSGAETSAALLFNTKFNTANTPFFRLSFVLQNRKKISRVSFIPEIGISFFKTTGVNNSVAYNGKYEIRNAYVEAAMMTRFVLNPVSKQRIFISAGLNAYLHISGENKYTSNINTNPGVTNDPIQAKSIISPSVSAGCLFSKISVFANYQYLGEQTTYLLSTWKVKRLSLGITYFLKTK